VSIINYFPFDCCVEVDQIANPIIKEYPQCAPPAYQAQPEQLPPVQSSILKSPVPKIQFNVSDPAPSLKWDDTKQAYYHDTSDGQLQVYQDGTTKNLKPLPRPAAPTPQFDESR
jgi:hypothetical protein